MERGGTLGVRQTVVPVERESAATDIDEGALLAAVSHGDAGALEALYGRHSRGVFSVALHLLSDPALAEEVVQETFLKLWRRPEAYQSSRGRLAPWLLGVAHHHAIDLLRRRRLEQSHRVPEVLSEDSDSASAPDVFGRASDDSDPAWRAGHAERRDVVLDALGTLPRDQRVPLELAYFRGLTQVEIATHLGEPLGTVKTRMRLGLQRLRTAPGVADLWSEA